jgi:hypothetical protein
MDSMADTISRPSATARDAAAKRKSAVSSRSSFKDVRTEDTGPRPTALVGIVLAVWTVALGLAVLICLALTAWVTAAHHDDAIHPAIATALQAWLLAQHTAIGVGAGSISVVPLGLTLVLGALLVNSGRQAARLCGASDLLDAATTAVALALPYAVIAALLTKPAQVGQVRPSPLQALIGSFALAVLCAGLGALRETGQLAPLVLRIRADVRIALRAGFAASGVVVGIGAAVFAVSLLADADRAGALAASMHGGYSAVALTSIISMAYAPNAVVWTAAYSLGPGFAVGTGTSVSLTGVHLGAVPALPLLAPLPDSGSTPVVAWLVIVGPALAGILAGWVLARTRAVWAPATDAAWWTRYRLPESAWGLAAGAAGGLALGLLAWLTAGSLGAGRMAVLGPSAWWTMLAATLEIGLGAAATIWVYGWLRLRDRAA